MIISITQKDLDNYEKAEAQIIDYPLYASASNLTRSQMVLISKILELNLENDTTLEVKIEKGK